MSEKLKSLGGNIRATWGIIETNIRNHFWCLLVLLLVTFLLSLTKGSDTDRLSIVSSVLSIVLAAVVVIFSFVQASDIKDLVREAWQRVEKKGEETSRGIAEISEQFKFLSEGAKAPTTDSGTISEADRGCQFDPKNVSWMTLIALYCMSKAHEKGTEIDLIYLSSRIDTTLKQKLNINYSTQGVIVLLEGVISGVMCFLPEGDIVRTQTFVAIKALPQNFRESVNNRIEQEKETERGEKVFGTLCPLIDESFGILRRIPD